MIEGFRPRADRTIPSRAPRLICAAALAAALSACAAGPEYRRPAMPQADRYTETALPAQTVDSPGQGGLAQRFSVGEDIPADWWKLFRSEALDGLIRDAMARSPNIAAAQAALRQAGEIYQSERGGQSLPRVDGQLGAQRQKINGIPFGQPDFASALNLYNASINVSYRFDLFGGTRRELEKLQASVDYQGFQLRAAYLALSANLATSAVQEASLRAQIEATERIAADQASQLDVLRRQFEAGGAARTDVLSQQTQLAQTEASLAPLRQSLAQTRHRLAALSGRLPSEGGLPAFHLDMFTLPDSLPVSVPSELARRRPDILASEALLRQASAQVGVAAAALYPQLTLSAGYGSQAGSGSQLFTPAAAVWNLGAGLAQPLFHGGELRSRKRAAEAAYEQAEAQYRETVLSAFQNVADALRALDNDAAGLRAQTQAWSSARDTLELARKQYGLGAIGYLSLLDAQRQYQQTTIALAQARAARYADTAALFQALGGGWRQDETEKPAAPPQQENTR